MTLAQPRPSRSSQFIEPSGCPLGRAAVLAFALLLLAPLAASAETAAANADLDVSEIVAKTVEALGGAERWAAIETLELRGNFTTFSTTHPFRRVYQKPDRYRFDHFEADMPVTMVRDGDALWWQNAIIIFSEVPWATTPPHNYAGGIRADGEFAGLPLLQEHPTTLVGRREFEGAEVYELEITLAPGLSERWMIDVETFLPFARVSPAGYTGLPSTLTTFFDDYREIEGVQISHYREGELRNRFSILEVSEVEIGGEVAPDTFALPIEPPLAHLATLVGTWEVAVETRRAPGMPWLPGKTTSTITSVYEGRALREDLEFDFFGTPRRVHRTYSYDRFRNLVKVFYMDDLTTHPILLEGDPAARPLALDNVSSDTAWGMMDRTLHNQQTLQVHGPDHFEVVWSASFDGGQTWAPLARFDYRRQAEAQTP